jgi:toxin ParE1/3/4
MRTVLAALAEADIEEIGDFIAQDNPRRAVTFVRELREQCAKLGPQPGLGAARPEFGEGIRLWPHGRYVILYSVRDDHVLVERVLHGARDLDGLLGAST